MMRFYRHPRTGVWSTRNERGVDFHEIPTDKIGLLGWLNSNTISMGKPSDPEAEAAPDTTLPPSENEFGEHVVRAPPPPPPGRPGSPPLFSQGRDADQIVEAILDLDNAGKVGQVADAVCDKILELSRKLI